MTEEQPTPNGSATPSGSATSPGSAASSGSAASNGSAAPPGTLQLGDILGAPFRDPRALPKFLGGCLAVVGILFFGLGLLALAGYLFQTAQRARRGEEHPMPEWGDLGQLLGDGLRVFGVVLGYLLPVFALTVVIAIIGFIPVLGGLASVVLGPLTLLLSLLAYALLPVALAQMVASDEIRSAFGVQENLRLIQTHLGTYVIFLLIVILIDVLSTASSALCGIGLIPGIFWGHAASGVALGRVARLMGI